MNEFIPVGKCLYCKKEFNKSVISRHLNSHLNKLVTGEGISYHIKVEFNCRYDFTPYFLNAWVDGTILFYDLDGFLRDIWLDCCDHLSEFNIKGERDVDYSHLWEDEDDDDEELENEGEGNESEKPGNNSDEFYSYGMTYPSNSGIPKEVEIHTFFTKGLVLDYEYDYKRTTQLAITVYDVFPKNCPEYIVLLSRNEPFKIECDVCKVNTATKICMHCRYKPESHFCETCANKHIEDCGGEEESFLLPVVNSPRVGICEYTGGRFDLERDTYQKP